MCPNIFTSMYLPSMQHFMALHIMKCSICVERDLTFVELKKRGYLS